MNNKPKCLPGAFQEAIVAMNDLCDSGGCDGKDHSENSDCHAAKIIWALIGNAEDRGRKDGIRWMKETNGEG